MREWLRLAGIGAGGTGRIVAGLWNGEQFAGSGDVVGARAAGEQAVVADAGESLRQHVAQEPAGEIARGEGHDLFAVLTIDTIMLPSGSGTRVAAGDQTAGGGWA